MTGCTMTPRIGATEVEACFSNQDGTGSGGQCLGGALASNLVVSSTVTILNTDNGVDGVQRQPMVGGSASAVEA